MARWRCPSAAAAVAALDVPSPSTMQVDAGGVGGGEGSGERKPRGAGVAAEVAVQTPKASEAAGQRVIKDASASQLRKFATMADVRTILASQSEVQQLPVAVARAAAAALSGGGAALQKGRPSQEMWELDENGVHWQNKGPKDDTRAPKG